jgi:hypothetical protein
VVVVVVLVMMMMMMMMLMMLVVMMMLPLLAVLVIGTGTVPVLVVVGRRTRRGAHTHKGCIAEVSLAATWPCPRCPVARPSPLLALPLWVRVRVRLCLD